LLRVSLPRLAILVFVVAVVVLVWRAGEGPISALETPELRPAPGLFDEEDRELARELGELRVGSFERPEAVPGYEILEETPREGDGARSAQLLVDTRSHGREGFTLITRDLKARYGGYDVVSVEFTDTSEVLDYNGGAIIVNTALGSRNAGFIYAPPEEGYLVRVED
jgi:hypothetical protein